MTDINFKVPIALIIFNRTQNTRNIISVLQKIRPKNLFVIADGPRLNIWNDVKSVAETRREIEAVDWNCEVRKNYSDTNLKGKKRISSGIDWVFNYVDQAIILEDDCIPNLSFFPFCEELLERYKDDERIMAISGNNFQFGKKRNNYSYYFSKYPHCWGWATWKRAWQHYDHELSLWPEVRDSKLLREVFSSIDEEKYWSSVFERVWNGDLKKGWDYVWMFSCWSQSGLTILPNSNLVSNVGFGIDASNTKNRKSKFSNIKSEGIDFPLEHPPFMLRDIQADHFTHKNMFSFTSRIFRRIRGLFEF